MLIFYSFLRCRLTLYLITASFLHTFLQKKWQKKSLWWIGISKILFILLLSIIPASFKFISSKKNLKFQEHQPPIIKIRDIYIIRNWINAFHLSRFWTYIWLNLFNILLSTELRSIILSYSTTFKLVISSDDRVNNSDDAFLLCSPIHCFFYKYFRLSRLFSTDILVTSFVNSNGRA